MRAAWPEAELVVDEPIVEISLPYCVITHDGTVFGGDAGGGRKTEERHTFTLSIRHEWQTDNIDWRATKVQQLTAELFTGPRVADGFLPALGELQTTDDPADKIASVALTFSISTLGDHF